MGYDALACPDCGRTMAEFNCDCGTHRAEECDRCYGSGAFLVCLNAQCVNCASHRPEEVEHV